jgi:hypothetical protein
MVEGLEFRKHSLSLSLNALAAWVEGLEFRKHSLSLSLNALAAWVEGLGLRTTRFALFASSWRTLRAKKIIIQRSASRIE